MKKKKRTLGTLSYSEFVVFGIITHLKDYTLCWHINQLLELSLRRIFAFEKEITQQMFYFPVYYQKEVFEILEVFLFVNEKHKIFLYPKLKPFQHILAISPDPLPSQRDYFFNKLNQSPHILLIRELSVDKCDELLTEAEILMQTIQRDSHE